MSENGSKEPAPGKGEGSSKRRKTIITPQVCYNCGEKVPPGLDQCPHCGAGPSRFNPAWVLRVAIGAFLGFLIWLIFYGA